MHRYHFLIYLLYYASSTVPLTKYSILHPITVAWFHLSDEIWIKLMPSPFFLSVHSSYPPWRLHGDIGTALLCYFMFVPPCLPPTNQRIKTEAFYCTCQFTGVELDKGRAQVETVWEQGLGENIWTQQRGSDRRLKNLLNVELCNLHCTPNMSTVAVSWAGCVEHSTGRSEIDKILLQNPRR
jgi:hypothetical protein